MMSTTHEFSQVAQRSGDAARAAGEGMEALEGEGRPGTIAQEALEAGTILTFDAHGSVDAEPAGSLPGEHVAGAELVE
jgi:hypothetical protein